MEGALIYDNLSSGNDLCDRFEKIRMRHSRFHKIWDNMLILLKKGLVPLATLVKVLSEENPVRKCYECEAQIIVQDVMALRGSKGCIPGLPVLMFGKGVAFALCNRPSCVLSLERGPYKMTRDKLRDFYVKLSFEYSGECCDYCEGINEEMRSHRCAKCKTKVYCGVECLNKDKVHLMLCQEGDTRKLKPSSSSRRERGGVRFEEISTAVAKCWVEEAPMPVRFF